MIENKIVLSEKDIKTLAKIFDLLVITEEDICSIVSKHRFGEFIAHGLIEKMRIPALDKTGYTLTAQGVAFLKSSPYYIKQNTPQKRLPKYKRVKPENAPKIDLTKRDVEILKDIYKYRFLNTSEIVGLAFWSPEKIKEYLALKETNEEKAKAFTYTESFRRRIQNRLQRLFHNRYLSRFTLEQFKDKVYGKGSPEFIYTVTTKSVDLVVEDPNEKKKKSYISSQNDLKEKYLAHRMMISKFHVVLELACRKSGYLELKLWEEGRAVKDSIRGKDGVNYIIEPDAYFCLKNTTKNQILPAFFEADRSTLDNSRFLQKIKGQYYYIKTGQIQKKLGVTNAIIIILTKTPERQYNLIRTIINGLRQEIEGEDENGNITVHTKKGCDFVYFSNIRLLNLATPEILFGKIWEIAEDSLKDKKYSFLDD